MVDANHINSVKFNRELTFSENKYYSQPLNNNNSVYHNHHEVNGKFSRTRMEDNIELELQKQNANLQIKLKESEDNVKEKEYFEKHCNELEEQLKEIRKQIHLLKQKNDYLEIEASKYQSALGIATNLNDNNVKFNEDILALQDILENYVTNLKPKIDVNINEAKKLLVKYGCQTKISDKEPNKPLIKAVLQRHVLEEIIAQAEFYFIRSNGEYYLESEIVYQTTLLINLMENFYNNRLGDDEITRLTPIRLRQQVYTALGTRGFNDIRNSDNEISKHNFIYMISKKINGMMNKYRIIKDIEKGKYINALAEDLVINVIRIFYFRLFTQEPIAQYRWFDNNEKINRTYMRGNWDEDDVEDMVVEICSFPLILKPFQDAPNGFKVCTPAKVFPLHIMNQSLTEKLMNLGTSVGRQLKNIYSSNDD
ncbi:hypothetical protein C1645_823937 [Glomus cerebriforme]|uniref:Uncharacterized protein n=1 Tax=Glomus cerebriforme TaxID=658196 RepID=A0A397T1A5_9GLOM|nr:hypothetical protein C1645_823937 [Glomus cerebriforme]